MRVIFSDNLLLKREGGGVNAMDLQPHLGLASLSAAIEAGGRHEAMLFDPKLALFRGEVALDSGLYRGLGELIVAAKPDVVGFTSLGCNFICTAKTAAHVRRLLPDVPIILGGPHASVLDRVILDRFPCFDAILRKECERTLSWFLEALPSGRFDDVPGVTYRRGGEVVANPGEETIADLSTLPRAAYHKYPIHELGLTFLQVEAGRGCPYSCTYCSTAQHFGRRFRLKPTASLVAELDDLHQDYGIRHFAISHDLFTVSRKKVLEFCAALAGRSYTWSCSARTDLVDQELLEAMATANCTGIYYGIETGSKYIQEVSRKHLDLAGVLPALEATQRVNIRPTMSFITGFIHERQEDQEQTLDLIGRCLGPWPQPPDLQLHLLTPEPGTPLIEEFGHMLEYDGHTSDFNFPTLEEDDAAVMRDHREVFMNHHYYRGVLPRDRHVFVTSFYGYLRHLGADVLLHLLDLDGSRLGRLVGRAYDWWSALPDRPPADADLTTAFLEYAYGANHYLVSLARYQLSAARLAGRIDGGRSVVARGGTPAKAGAGPQLALSTSATVLHDLHDCPSLLEFLATHRGEPGTAVPADLARRREDRVLLLLPAVPNRPPSVQMFTINQLTRRLLESFIRPRSWEESIALLGPLAPNVAASSALRDALVSQGVLSHV